MYKKCIFICAMLLCILSQAQDRLLTKKIVYTIDLTSNSINRFTGKDSLQSAYLVGERQFYQAMELVLNKAKNKEISFCSFNKRPISYDTIIENICKQYSLKTNKKHSKQDVNQLLNNDIKAIKFWQQWTYDTKTMLINKQTIAFCPVIKQYAIGQNQDGDKSVVESVNIDVGWIFANESSKDIDTVLLCNNIEYNQNLYNPEPYMWWDNNLEAEFSIPFFELWIQKAEQMQIRSYEEPNSVDAYLLPEVLKRRQHNILATLTQNDTDNNVIELDTTINLKYNSEDIELLRFGDQIFFDNNNLNFIVKVNYQAPLVRIFAQNGDFRGFYPLYYIRKK